MSQSRPRGRADELIANVDAVCCSPAKNYQETKTRELRNINRSAVSHNFVTVIQHNNTEEERQRESRDRNRKNCESDYAANIGETEN